MLIIFIYLKLNMKYLIFLLFSFTFCYSKEIFLISENFHKENINMGMIFLQGAKVSNDKYVPLLQKTQDKLLQPENKINLWISIPEFIDNTPNPLFIKKKISSSINLLHQKGLPKNSKLLYSGHSLGGAFLVNYLYSENKNNSTHVILLSSFITNKYSNFDNKILTISGELDGLCRITRMAENYYHGNTNMIILENVNHWSFASGEPTKKVLKNDIYVDKSYEKENHNIISNIIVSYIMSNMSVLKMYKDKTYQLLKPILKLLEYEGSTKLNVSVKSSKYLEDNLKYFYNLSKITKINEKNKFYPLNKIYPDPLPTVTFINKNEINTTSITNLEFVNDKLDTGFYPISAISMNTKLNSFSRIHQHQNIFEFKLNSCSSVNKRGLEIVLKELENTNALQRYYSQNKKIIIAEEDKVIKNKYKDWLTSKISYKNSNKQIIEIQSPTYYDTKLKNYQYCKFVSPAYLMELIYIDLYKP